MWWIFVLEQVLNSFISSSKITRHWSKQEDPALYMFMSRQHRLFMEFSVLIGWNVQGYQKNVFPLLLPEEGEERHGLLTKKQWLLEYKAI